MTFKETLGAIGFAIIWLSLVTLQMCGEANAGENNFYVDEHPFGPLKTLTAAIWCMDDDLEPVTVAINTAYGTYMTIREDENKRPELYLGEDQTFPDLVVGFCAMLKHGVVVDGTNGWMMKQPLAKTIMKYLRVVHDKANGI